MKYVVNNAINGRSIQDVGKEAMESKGLLAITIIGIIMAFIVIPICSCLVYCLCKDKFAQRQFRKQNSRNNNAANTRQTVLMRPGFQSSRSYAIWKQQKVRIVGCLAATLSVFCIVLALLAGVGLGGSFYFNDVFTYSLNRSNFIIDDVMTDIDTIVDSYTGEIKGIGTKLEADIEAKKTWGEATMKAIEKVFTGGGSQFGPIIDLAQRSGALPLIAYLLIWENSVIKPLQEYLNITAHSVEDYSKILPNYTLLYPEVTLMGMIICEPDVRIPNNCYRSNRGAVTCRQCLLPSQEAPLMTAEDVQIFRNLNSTWHVKFQELGNMKVGQLVLSQDQLLAKVNNLQVTMMDSFEDLVDFYTDWVEMWVEPVIDGNEQCGVKKPKTTLGTTPATLPTFTLPENFTFPTSVTPWPITLPFTLPPFISLPPDWNVTIPQAKTQQEKISEIIYDTFYIRYAIALALMIVAAVQLTLLVVGFILVLVYAGGSHKPNLYKAGWVCILIGAIVFVAFTNPLLGLLASGHFFAGGFIDKSVCYSVKQDNFEIFDELVPLKEVLPRCVLKLVHEIDPNFWEHRTISNFLRASYNNAGLNEFLRFEETKFIQEAVSLKHLNLSSDLEIASPQFIEYMDDLSRVLSQKDRLLALENVNVALNLDDQLETMKNCYQCGYNSISTNQTANRTARIEEAKEISKHLLKFLQVSDTADFNIQDMVSLMATSESNRDTLIRSTEFIQEYFDEVLVLVKRFGSSAIQDLLDNFVQAGNKALVLGPLFDFYDGIVREYGCIELVGSMNAFWFCVGVYMVFGTIAALLAFFIAAVLKGQK